MANIRAYKLAEELGIDRAAIVERAAEVGIELKSPMAAVDDEVAAQLREKLGKVAEPTSVVTERRVQQTGGVRGDPPPQEGAPRSGARADRRGARRGGRSEPIAAEPEPAREEPEIAPEEPAVEIAEPEPRAAADRRARREEARARGPARVCALAPDAPERAPGPDRSGRQRKLVREVVNLREQETLARQAVGRAPRAAPGDGRSAHRRVAAAQAARRAEPPRRGEVAPPISAACCASRARSRSASSRASSDPRRPTCSAS